MIRFILGAVFWVAIFAATVAAGDAALPGNHSLTQSQAGELLVAELRCAACHESSLPDPQIVRTAPDLTRVGARVSPQFLLNYLRAPSEAHPGTTMPDMLASRPESERGEIAEALTHFLIAQSEETFQSEVREEADRRLGRELFHSVGCVACHGPKEQIADAPPVAEPDDAFVDETVDGGKSDFPPVKVNLEHITGKYSVRSLADFLFQPLRVRRSGRMPDMKLTPTEALAVASYLIGEQPRQQTAVQIQDSLVVRGRQYFQELNCAACHSLPGITAAPLITSLNSADLTNGCLSSTSVRSPRFHLTNAQILAITAAMQEKPVAETDTVRLAKTLTAFRCIACHVRDDYGGVPEAYDAYFSGTQLKMGDDGRIPPPLTLVGAKLQSAWLKKVLFDGESVRPYMFTRMPQYGTDNLHHLPEIVAGLDVIEGRELKIPSPESHTPSEREREKVLRAAGRELLGDQGLNCVACHNFNGKPAPVNQGIDLLTTYHRLQPAWFDAYVRQPNAFRPRTVMPTAWPNGIAAHKTILEGDTNQQIEAIWYYLSLGTSAADPPGIRGVSTRLTVGDVARIHRGRSRVAGFRGIAVGLPKNLNYAFNAETGTLSAIWTGDFVNVNWNGQGSGDFNPASTPVTFAQDVSFTQLQEEDSPWPLMPVMSKDDRLNPNPLYPKNIGYQFRGYMLDATSTPTFLYQLGMIAIEDRMTAADDPSRGRFRRVIRLRSPTPQVLWFRALTGEIQRESDRTFTSDRLRLTFSDADPRLRPTSADPRQSELLLRLNLPQGESTLELLYEPISR
ncbi:MAG: hypothetical protein KDA96_09890 [Planctomycetaceae bacterium]|nr:hypothetical protein [Planctomycetaceae bacterium]